MAQYLVTMDLPEAEPDGPLPSIEGLVGTIRKTILPSLEALSALKAQGRVLAGGYPSGQRSIMLIVEADSEERVLGMLQRVPCWDLSATDVARLYALEEPPGEYPAGSGVASLDRAREERGRPDREAKRNKTGTRPTS
ncbi:MAG: hypothetical protein M3426_16550 [Actinomycetota bacterium]|jgi:hypothetical protein|nr:hypothetical protein [Actinomycetota bacterium]